MKKAVLSELRNFRDGLKLLRREIRKNRGVMIHHVNLRNAALELVTQWDEKLRSPLEHKFKLPSADINDMAEQMKQLYRLSLSSNRKTSYMKILNSSLNKFDERFMVPVNFTTPVMQSPPNMGTDFDIRSIFPDRSGVNESEYMKEAIICAEAGCLRAAVVLGWCAVIDEMQSYFIRKGFDHLNRLSDNLQKNQSGKFKRWNKKFNITTKSELQTIIRDADLITLAEGDNIITYNQAKTLHWCLHIRNQSAHPGEFSLTKDHLKVFFSDIRYIIIENQKLNQ